MKFSPLNIDLFMGGTFELESQPKTVGELRQWLQEVDEELAGWGCGDDNAITEVSMHRNKLDVTLGDGIL